jgi:hypothetical protein
VTSRASDRTPCQICDAHLEVPLPDAYDCVMRTRSYTCMCQCLRPQRCANMAAHGRHQIQHFATNGHSRARCTDMLRQIPPASRPCPDTRRCRPQGNYCSSPNVYSQLMLRSAPIRTTSPSPSYPATTPSYHTRASRLKDMVC